MYVGRYTMEIITNIIIQNCYLLFCSVTGIILYSPKMLVKSIHIKSYSVKKSQEYFFHKSYKIWLKGFKIYPLYIKKKWEFFSQRAKFLPHWSRSFIGRGLKFELLDSFMTVLLNSLQSSFDGLKAGLPDGLFSNQKSQFWRALVLKMLLYFMTI
jgi:hypothetical protein